MRKHTYRVILKEFLKLFNFLAFNGIHTVSRWLNLLFKDFHQERKRRNERISTRLACAPRFVVILPPIYRHLVYRFFIKTLIIMSIFINNHRPYVCDPLGLYISLVNNSISPIIPYWSTLINYIYQPID